MSSVTNDITILTIEELADKFKVQPKVIKQAMANGQLKCGVHFMFIGKEVRFQWCQKLIDAIHSNGITVSHNNKPKMNIGLKPKDPVKMPLRIGRGSFNFNCVQ